MPLLPTEATEWDQLDDSARSLVYEMLAQSRRAAPALARQNCQTAAQATEMAAQAKAIIDLAVRRLRAAPLPRLIV